MKITSVNEDYWLYNITMNIVINLAKINQTTRLIMKIRKMIYGLKVWID